MKQLQQIAMVKPRLDLVDYFAGQTRGFGVFVDRFGGVRRQFGVDIDGQLQDGKLVLTEDFAFDDGERSRRIWRITPLGAGRYSGTAGDVIGEARGEVAGNTLRWAYDLHLPIGARTVRVRFDDLMVLQTDDILISRARLSKFGLSIGEVLITFQTVPAAQKDGPATASTSSHSQTGASHRLKDQTTERVPA
jgi:hypothetical protein